jgi:hypothetical protein
VGDLYDMTVSGRVFRDEVFERGVLASSDKLHCVVCEGGLSMMLIVRHLLPANKHDFEIPIPNKKTKTEKS